jgi:hypothetical protein
MLDATIVFCSRMSSAGLDACTTRPPPTPLAPGLPVLEPAAPPVPTEFPATVALRNPLTPVVTATAPPFPPLPPDPVSPPPAPPVPAKLLTKVLLFTLSLP